jgi:hypothetical protein
MSRGGTGNQVATASGIDAAVGVWLFISAFVFNASGTGFFWNNIIFGIVVAVLAGIRAFGAYSQNWLSWLNVLAGIWVFISPWSLAFSHFQGAAWNNYISGIAVALLAIWSTSASSAMTGRNPTTV